MNFSKSKIICLEESIRYYEDENGEKVYLPEVDPEKAKQIIQREIENGCMIVKLIFEAVLSEVSEGRQIQINKRVNGKQVSYLDGCRDLLKLLHENELYKIKKSEYAKAKTQYNREERKRRQSFWTEKQGHLRRNSIYR